MFYFLELFKIIFNKYIVMPFVLKHKPIDYYAKTLELLAKREKEVPLKNI